VQASLRVMAAHAAFYDVQELVSLVVLEAAHKEVA